MTTTYLPRGTFGPNTMLGPHQGLRITFAQTRSAATPDFVEEADFRQNLDYLVQQMASGTFALDPASGVVVAPGELAATIDFANTGGGSISVAQALADIQGALYGPLDFARRTYLRQVQLLGIGGVPWGTPTPRPSADTEMNPLAFFGGWGTVLLVVGVGVYLLPEIKLALRGSLRGAR